MADFRSGIGYDIHRLVEGRKLILGGVEIPSERGLMGHSDADVLTHAICDALLGAAGMGDIGRHFPDSDQRYKDASSLALLDAVLALILQHGYDVINVDATVIIERPKLAPYMAAMRQALSEKLRVPPDAVNIKAKTNEGLGDIGAGNAAAAFATCSLKDH